MIAGYTREFADEGLKLTVDESVFEHVVKRALKRELGARGLRMALVPTLEEAAYRHFGKGGDQEVRLTVAGDAIVIADA